MSVFDADKIDKMMESLAVNLKLFSKIDINTVDPLTYFIIADRFKAYIDAMNDLNKTVAKVNAEYVQKYGVKPEE